MYEDNFYTDEDLDFSEADGNGLPDGLDSIHSWDYFAPEETERRDDFTGMSASDANIEEPLRSLLRMIRQQPWQITAAKAFYEQALFMADYEEDAPIVGFMSYFPSFRDMSVPQLRSYFAIRRQLRLGKFPDVSLSYIFVYVYETLMKVGVNTAEEGYEILSEINEAYRKSEPKLGKYLTPWLRDYVVYNNLSSHFPEVFKAEREQDDTIAILSSLDTADEQALFSTFCDLGKYDPRKGALFTKERSCLVSCTAAVLRQLVPVLEKSLHHRIGTLFAGKRVKRSTSMFSNALFYDPSPVRNVEIEVSPFHRYFCRGGLWTRDEYVGDNSYFAKLVGAILREIDCQLRELLDVKPRLKPSIHVLPYREQICDAVKAWIAEDKRRLAAEEAERRRGSINYGKLGRIRNDADVIKDKLLDGVPTEDDIASTELMPSIELAPSLEPMPPIEPTSSMESMPAVSIEPVPPVVSTPPAETSPSQPSHDEESREQAFLKLMLTGGDWRQYLRSIHVPEGVMVENINNEMVDKIGDIVIEDNGDGIQLIDDYREDIERIIYNNV